MGRGDLSPEHSFLCDMFVLTAQELVGTP